VSPTAKLARPAANRYHGSGRAVRCRRTDQTITADGENDRITQTATLGNE
jgi:hypothetical protein